MDPSGDLSSIDEFHYLLNSVWVIVCTLCKLRFDDSHNLHSQIDSQFTMIHPCMNCYWKDPAAVASRMPQAWPFVSRFCGWLESTQCDGLKGFLVKSITDPGRCNGRKKTKCVHFGALAFPVVQRERSGSLQAFPKKHALEATFWMWPTTPCSSRSFIQISQRLCLLWNERKKLSCSSLKLKTHLKTINCQSGGCWHGDKKWKS